MFEVVVLAAGKGSRMMSALPKVLHPLAGKPMLRWATDTAQASGADRVHVVVGFNRDQIYSVMGTTEPWLHYCVQEEQLGTGHAVAQALSNIGSSSTVVITYGDVPLLLPETIGLIAKQAENGLAVLTELLDDPSGYGRIVRQGGDIVAIVEHKDATEEQRLINEVNTGVMAVSAEYLQRWLPALSANNAQGEYYLTDIVAMAVQEGVTVSAIHPSDRLETTGVNSRCQLAELERAIQFRLATDVMEAGVTLADPGRFDVRGELQVGQDVSIDVNCIFEGRVEIAEGVVIGPNCLIRNSRIGRGSRVEANTVIEGGVLAEGCVVGPFARIRPGTELCDGSKIGNFVEIKKSRVNRGSKINHLSYIGDAEIGCDANIGAGVITCNYDGANKHRTHIGDQAFVGSNCSLVAPVDIGDRVTVGAGSVITNDVPGDHLSVARGRQKNIADWKRPTKQS